MELGAGVELATAAMPNLFLPLACAANVVKVRFLLSTSLGITFILFIDLLSWYGWYSNMVFVL